MNYIIIILEVFLSILAIILIVALFTKNDFEIVSQVLINKPKEIVYDYLKMLRNSEKYNKWVMLDPNMKKEFRGDDGTVGFVYSWDSLNKQVGKGEQEITNLSENERVDYEIRFDKPFKGISKAWFILETVGEHHTRVTWVFASSTDFMMKVIHLVFNLKRVLGKDMQMSLNNLKNLLEK